MPARTDAVLQLRGITWDHPRGRAPLEAASRLFAARNPGVSVTWDARALRAFEDVPLAVLAADYDLLAVDHPHIGQAFADSALVALDDLTGGPAWLDKALDHVGASAASYRWEGHQWAAPVDAAAQVAACRSDLLGAVGVTTPPASWDEVFALADELPADMGVAIAANSTHMFSCWLSLCHDVARDRSPHLDGRPQWWRRERIDTDVARHALERLCLLLGVCDARSLTWDPISLLLEMSTGNRIAYAPLIYGYVTYARPDSARHPIRFVDAPTLSGQPVGTVLGGVGLAVSSSSTNADLAGAFVELVASQTFQRGDYFRTGGQPSHRSAWTDPEINTVSGDFFAATFATVNTALLRPRESGFPEFQRRAGHLLHDMVRRQEKGGLIVDAVNDLWSSVQV